MVIIGEIRNNKKFEFTFENITNKLLVQSTSADEAYIFNLAITYNQTYGNLGASPYLEFCYNAVPLLNFDRGITVLLKQNYVGHPGGEYILSLPVMSFGMNGIIIFSIFEFCVLYFIIARKSLMSYIWYLFILCTAFRIVWYGISYIEMGIIYIIPLMILCSRFFKNGIIYTYEGEKL